MRLPKQIPSRLQMFFFEGTDAIRLDSFRRAFAVAFLFYTAYLFGNVAEWLTDFGFHFSAGSHHLHMPTPWPTMPTWMVPIFGAVLFASTLSLIVGYRVRMMTWAVLACAVYVQRVDPATAFTLSKLFVVAFAVLALSPPVRTVVDAAGCQRQLQSVWPIRIMQATLLIMYFTSGICKACHGDWLIESDVMWTIVQGTYRTKFAATLLNIVPSWGWTVMQYSVLVFEVFGPLLFLHKRTVRWGLLWGTSFHLGIALMMKTVFFFSFQMVMFYSLFLSPDVLKTVRAWLIRSDNATGASQDFGLLSEIPSAIGARLAGSVPAKLPTTA